MARVLRHEPKRWGLALDDEGWCAVDLLLAGATKHGVALSLENLIEIVATNDKQRFMFSVDRLRIRASQGHSIQVDLKLEAVVPPPVLYHGTVRSKLAAIRRDGLSPMNRHAVHLSATKETAKSVGSRRGPPVVLVVDSFAMQRDGYLFYCSANNVWLTASVPPRYLTPNA